LVDQKLLSNWEDFLKDEGEGKWVMVFDMATGIPTLMEGKGIAWIPGSANSLKGGDLGLPDNFLGKDVPLEIVEKKALEFIAKYPNLFGIVSLENLSINKSSSGSFSDYLYFINFNINYKGIPVENASISFRLNNGNLVQIAQDYISKKIESIDLSNVISSNKAWQILWDFVGGSEETDEIINPGTLSIIPILSDKFLNDQFFLPGEGIDYKVVYKIAFKRKGVLGLWEAIINAQNGEILSFSDVNRYGYVHGGIYPNDRPSPETNMLFPFVDCGGGLYANSAGYFEGNICNSSLAGLYVKIYDTCGTISHSTTTGDLDFGSSSGTDCTTPGFGGNGNTHSSRTQYYQVTNIKRKAMVYLPSNLWLQGQLEDNVNLNQTCNAYWDGNAINFFKSSAYCDNTGEIPGVSLHEFGHGLDQNDGTPPADYGTGEAYGDFTAVLQTHSSCIGNGFFYSANCEGYGDACLSCTGIRDIDWDKHSSHLPHIPEDMASNSCSGCTSYYCESNPNYAGPCGYEGHCESLITSETLWDLATRDLIYWGMDSSTAWQTVDRLWYLSRPIAGASYACPSLTTTNGCGGSNYFTVFRVVDDCDGDLSNGTPHASAIFGAFSRHKIACVSVNNQDQSNCCSSLNTPILNAPQIGNNLLNLSWNSIPNAQKYNIYRNEMGCNFGFTKVGETIAPTTSFSDESVVNGFTYYYRIQAIGTSESCFSSLSNCVAATPQSCAGNLTLDKNVYNCLDTLTIKLVDSDLAGMGSYNVEVWSDIETVPENVLVIENPPSSGIFIGTINTSSSTSHNDGAIGVSNGSTITVRYIDSSSCGNPNVNVEKTAGVDCIGPIITNVQVSNITFNSAIITWDTNEYSTSKVVFGTSIPPTIVEEDTSYKTKHSVLVKNLYPCSEYFFFVSSTDSAGNTTSDSNNGSYYTFTTEGIFNIYFDDMEFGESGFTVEDLGSNNLWHQTTDPICSPASNSPTTSWYFGRDENCTYNAGESERVRGRLRSPIIKNIPPNAFIHFWQRRKTESSCGQWDRSFIEISTDGGKNWKVLSEICDESNTWVQSENYSLKDYVGKDIMVGFRFDSIDGFVNDFFGWMIDDFAISIPSTCRKGTIDLDQPIYNCSNDLIQIKVQDLDLNKNPNLQETGSILIQSTTETTPESVVITEGGVNSAYFFGSIYTTQNSPSQDGKLSVKQDDTITAFYNDEDNGSGQNATVYDFAKADCSPLIISNIAVLNVDEKSAVIVWKTNKLANSKLIFGTSIPPSNIKEEPRKYVLDHSITLKGLLPCTTYYFYVSSADILENSTYDNNGGAYYSFTTKGRQYLLNPDNVENGPDGWIADGPGGTIWHIDTCRSFSPTHAWKAGSSQYCPGSPWQMTDTTLTSQPMNLGTLGNGYYLKFMTYYYSRNDWGWVQISTDGGNNWTDIATFNASNNSEKKWALKEYDLSSFSGNALIRFFYHSNFWLDGRYAPEGWYLDDIEISKFATCSNGNISLDKLIYGCLNDSIQIRLEDSDLVGYGNYTVQIFSLKETVPENVLLTETPANSGIFIGYILTDQGPPVPNNGYLSVSHNDKITARYIDTNDGNGNYNITKDALAYVDCKGPEISNILVSNISDIEAVVTWDTDENSNSKVTYGTAIPPSNIEQDTTKYVKSHSINLTALESCKTYYFSVTSSDIYNNSSTDNNDGIYYNFTTLPQMYAFGPDFVENGPGLWTASGQWHISGCRAHSGTHSWKVGDPECPGSVNSSTMSYLTSQTINLGSSGNGYYLKFWEWVNVEGGNSLYIQISTNGGSTWTTLEQRNGPLHSSSWTLKEINLSNYSGNILIRFYFYATITSYGGEGWYIDDIRIGKHIPCSYGTVALNQDIYGCSQTIEITLEDSDLSGSGNHIVEIYSTIETNPEIVNLTENPQNSGIFLGSILTTSSPPQNGDGKLSIATGSKITVRYLDQNDGQGHTNIYKYDYADVDCQPPVITNVSVFYMSDYDAIISWFTDKPSNSKVNWGTSIPPSNVSQDLNNYVTYHNIELVGLSSCTDYKFSVTSSDIYENTATDDNFGSYYSFQSIGQIYAFGLDDVEGGQNGWSATGQWHISGCRAHSGTHSWKVGDPECPGSVNSSTMSYLTSQTINLGSSGNGYYLKFWEWVNVEGGNSLYIQISTNGGSTWTTLEQRNGPLHSSSWTLKEINLSNYSGNILIRFYFYATITSYGGEGWYIDDIRVGKYAYCTPYINYSSSSFTQIQGDGDNYFELGEKWAVSVTLKNDGLSNATGVKATLSGNGITVCNNPGNFGSIPSNGSASYTYEFVISQNFSPCGGTIGFDITNKICNEKSPAGDNEMDAFAINVGEEIIPPPQEVVIQPIADSFINEQSQGTNYGSQPTMDVQRRATRNRRSLVKFDLSTIPPNSTINSATLELYSTVAPTTSQQLDIHRITSSWQETTVTWSSQPTFDSVISSSIQGGTGTGWKIWDVTGLVKDWYLGTYQNYGFLVKSNLETGTTAYLYSFATKENSTNKPILRVNYTPPPEGWDCSYVGNGSCGLAAPKPVPDGKWVLGTPLKASKVNGDIVHITWDVSTCASSNYNVYSGPLSSVSSYSYDTWTCNIGNTGNADVAISNTGNAQFFLIVPVEGSKEGSHGRNSSGNERNANGIGHCGINSKDTSGTCP